MKDIKYQKVTDVEWHETRNLYRGLTTNSEYFANRPVYINRRPSISPVFINPCTLERIVIVSHFKKGEIEKTFKR